MKKINLFLALIVAVALIGLTNCKKDLKDTTPVSKNYVGTVDASFQAIRNVDITYKALNADPFAAPTETQRTWTMLSNNSDFYHNGIFEKVDGREFMTNSIAYVFWHNSANNPITFAVQDVYSNQTPAENVRVVSEGKDAIGHVNYLGMTDFNPSTANFPLAVNEYRLGDVLTLNADEITALPGGNLTISATFGLAPIDLAGTESQLSLVNTDGLGNKILKFPDIKYGVAVPTTVTIVNNATTPIAPVLDVPLYSGTDSKVVGPIIITITENYTGIDGQPKTATITKSIDAFPNGQGMKLKLGTNKIGWFDSQIISMKTTDITIESAYIEIN
jgi:hypothetical protein